MAIQYPAVSGFQTLKAWAEALVKKLEKDANDPSGVTVVPKPVPLAHRIQSTSSNLGTERAVLPGVLMFNPSTGVPEVSDGAAWVPLLTAATMPATPLIQYGSLPVIENGGRAKFDTPYARSPIVIVTAHTGVDEELPVTAMTYQILPTSFNAKLVKMTNAYSKANVAVSGSVHWLAIGDAA